MKTELSKIVKDEYDKSFVKKNEANLLMGLMDNEDDVDFPIVTEIKRVTRSRSRPDYSDVNENQTHLDQGKKIVQEFAQSLINNLNSRIPENNLSVLMKDCFKMWDKTKLIELVNIAESSGRSYGKRNALLSEYDVLKERFIDLMGTKDEDQYLSNWLLIFHKQKYYKDLENILHFALCCFVKSPLEATAESIGSVLNSHGCKERCSLLPSSLSNEVQIVWNGPPEFHPDATIVITEALNSHFENNAWGMRFYARSKLSLISSTIAKYASEKARIKFS